jgi:hypothetical protein
LSVERKLKTSFLSLVLVRVGAVFAGHFTLAGQVIVRAVPSAVKIKVKPQLTPLDDGVLLIVNVVILAFNEHVNKLPLFNGSVKELELILTLVAFSVYVLFILKPLVLTL